MIDEQQATVEDNTFLPSIAELASRSSGKWSEWEHSAAIDTLVEAQIVKWASELINRPEIEIPSSSGRSVPEFLTRLLLGRLNCLNVVIGDDGFKHYLQIANNRCPDVEFGRQERLDREQERAELNLGSPGWR
jgi:hypothetical protein